ncbi:hypothetical protein Adt_42528 [Abeliophyllum distichum]|uniref:Retrotransposon Copia-like N-terminal domain-containing protein n=1 Tax=Abeliophyllum distichum TaxID=126358 RepID=A0ABD1PRY1_9LAMI
MYSFLFYSATGSASTISANINSIPILNGSNFKHWKENIMIVLGCMDLDLALRIEQPPALTTESSTEAKRDIEKWDRSNRISLMIMKRSIQKPSGTLYLRSKMLINSLRILSNVLLKTKRLKQVLFLITLFP